MREGDLLGRVGFGGEDDGSANVMERGIEMHEDEINDFVFADCDTEGLEHGDGRGDILDVGIDRTRGVMEDGVKGFASGDAGCKAGLLEMTLES